MYGKDFAKIHDFESTELPRLKIKTDPHMVIIMVKVRIVFHD